MKVLLVSLAAMLIFIVALTNQPVKSPTLQSVVGELPIVGSTEKFEDIINEFNERQNYLNRVMPVRETAEMAKEESATLDSGSADNTSDFSSTNKQVDGVDEADKIKNDGEFIYQIIENQLVISKVYPADEMAVVYKETFSHSEFYPQEMYVDQENLILIGMHSMHDQQKSHYKDFTQVKVYELKDRSNLTLVREAEIEGYYSSSRKIADQLYVVTNKHLPYYMFNEPQTKEEKEVLMNDMKPVYRDTALSRETQVVDWDEMYYFPNSAESNYLIVAGMNISNLETPISVNTYLGAGSTIYATKEHLYVTRTHFEYNPSAVEKMAELIIHPDSKRETLIYKFKLNDGVATFLHEGKVEGSLLNQFSMDEHNGYFRVATTNGNMWDEKNPSENLLFVLNEYLEVVGSIKGLAKGERIYSARFMGDRGYIVTFKQVDPLFVLDLQDPTNPTVLGELKIPGFSDYLHPYDESHIIGFGKDTIENNNGGAMVQGFKMALFDITDVNNPKEKFVEIIGGRGTHSELLHNHKALLFSKSKNIIGFPIEVYETQEVQQNERMMYETFSFQGAYVYGLDLNNGFQLKKRISHYDTNNSIEKNWDYQKFISRLIYIDENLYTISNSKIEVHDLTSFDKMGQLLLK